MEADVHLCKMKRVYSDAESRQTCVIEAKAQIRKASVLTLVVRTIPDQVVHIQFHRKLLALPEILHKKR